jgi:hypothetical protein
MSNTAFVKLQPILAKKQGKRMKNQSFKTRSHVFVNSNLRIHPYYPRNKANQYTYREY